MLKKLLLTILISFTNSNITQAQQLTPEIQEFINKIDGASLDDLEKELSEGIKGLKLFADFVSAPSGGIKDYTIETEQFTEPFKIDTSKIKGATQQFNNIGFTQSFKDNKSLIKFQKNGNNYWNLMSLPEGITETLLPTKIYYKDGSTNSKNIGDKKLSFFWEENWGNSKVIDSITITYNLQYIKAYDSLLLSKKTKKLNYKTGQIKVKNLDKNFLYITISDAFANKIYVDALNRDGKPLNQISSSFSPNEDDNEVEEISQILAVLEDVESKLKKKDFKNTNDLKNYLLKKMQKVKTKADTDGVYHLKYFFEGNIENVKLYIETKEGHKTIPFTATNNTVFKDVLLKETKEQIIFMDKNANELFAIPARQIQRIGNRFFLEDETYFYLNLKTKSLDKIDALKIFETTNNLVFIQKNSNSDFNVFNKNLKQLSDIEFTHVWSVDKKYAHTLDQQKNNYAIDSRGTINKIEGVSEIGDMSEGYLIARLDDKYGFIAPSGEIIAPIIYSGIEPFSEGLAIVKNEDDMYGYVNSKNDIKLPFIYERANSFENGIALVSIDNYYCLINKKGEILVKSNSSAYSTSGTGTNKIYTLGDKKYDAFAQQLSQ